MKKNILRWLIALFFIFITVLSCAFLKEFKDQAKEAQREKENYELNEFYVYNLENTAFNLPVIIINTNGNPIKRQEDIIADMQVYDSDGNILEEYPSFEEKINISIRGNSTSKYPKKQYSLEIINNKGEEKSEELLGMESGADWVLNGPFSDKSLMRNYIAYKTSRNIMEYAPDVRFCEVFLIDDNSKVIEEKHYKGVYVMIEKIKRNENRVNITKSQDNVEKTSFILSKDRKKQNDIGLNSYGIQTYIDFYGLNIEYPKKELTDEKYQYINKFISEFERVLYSDKFNDPIEGYRKYIDVQSFVDYYIINEFFKNTDAGLLSTYFYKDYEEKLKAGPIWDFNKSLGNHNEDIGVAYDYQSFFMINRPWFDRLMEDKSFSDEVIKRYKQLRTTYLSDNYLIEMIDKTVTLLGDATKRNFYKWPIEICNQAEVFEENNDVTQTYSLDIEPYKEFLDKNNHLLKSTEYRAKSYDEEILMMKEFIINRGKWMDDNIDTLSKWSN
ncbi:CotH kinase family protein [Clostridium sp.]|uniref:CotH kinase family protein n=1 Tax=Clostridium sp. TaxID=1506 RepID=UPI003520C8B5